MSGKVGSGIVYRLLEYIKNMCVKEQACSSCDCSFPTYINQRQELTVSETAVLLALVQNTHFRHSKFIIMYTGTLYCTVHMRHTMCIRKVRIRHGLSMPACWHLLSLCLFTCLLEPDLCAYVSAQHKTDLRMVVEEEGGGGSSHENEINRSALLSPLPASHPILSAVSLLFTGIPFRNPQIFIAFFPWLHRCECDSRPRLSVHFSVWYWPSTRVPS